MSGSGGQLGRAGDVVLNGGAASLPEQTVPGDFWKPAGDAQWLALDWAPGCLIEKAAHPEHGMPALVWKACDGVSGCQLIVPNWYAKNQIYLGFSSGYRDGSTARLGVSTGWGDDSEWRSAVYGEAWKPLTVWRGARRGCNGVSPRPAPAHTCVISAKLNGGAVAGLLPATSVNDPPLATYPTSGRLNVDCSDELAANYDTQGRTFLYDVKRNKETGLAPAEGEAMPPALSGSVAYFSRWFTQGGAEAMDGWVWTRQGGPRALIAPPKKFVVDIRADGTTLAWLQLDMTTINHAAAGELWASPTTTIPSEVVPHLVRSVPSAQLSRGYKAIGGGYYALVEQHDDKSMSKLHIYRLSDGHHWLVPTLPSLQPGPIVWLTSDEILYQGLLPSGAAHTLLRQDLTKLGPGD